MFSSDFMRKILAVGVVVQGISTQHLTVLLQTLGENPRDTTAIMQESGRDDDWRSFMRVEHDLLVAIIPNLLVPIDDMPIRSW